MKPLQNQKLILQQLLWTVSDIEKTINIITGVSILYSLDTIENQAHYKYFIDMLKETISDMRRETANAEGDTRYEDYNWTFHDI